MAQPGSENVCSLTAELVRGKTRLSKMISVSPVKFIAPESHARGGLCFMSSYGGGMLGGDSVLLDVVVEEGAGLVMLPQANSRAYTNSEGRLASQKLHVELGRGARFVFNADPLVLHKQSNFLQQTIVKLQDGAGAILVDWFSVGRSENGERFLFSSYEAELEVYLAGEKVLVDRQKFVPAEAEYQRAGAFAEYSQMLNIFFLGDLAEQSAVLAAAFKLEGSSDFVYSLTNNQGYGILRFLGLTRQSLQGVINRLYTLLAEDEVIAFDALERKM